MTSENVELHVNLQVPCGTSYLPIHLIIQCAPLFYPCHSSRILSHRPRIIHHEPLSRICPFQNLSWSHPWWSSPPLRNKVKCLPTMSEVMQHIQPLPVMTIINCLPQISRIHATSCWSTMWACNITLCCAPAYQSQLWKVCHSVQAHRTHEKPASISSCHCIIHPYAWIP